MKGIKSQREAIMLAGAVRVVEDRVELRANFASARWLCTSGRRRLIALEPFKEH